MKSSNTFALFSQPYLDRYNQCYKNIVTINTMPTGPLSAFVRTISFPVLSEFKETHAPCSRTKKCGLVVMSMENGCQCNGIMDVDEVPSLMSFLMSNQYTINTDMTKMFNTGDLRFQTDNANKLICFVTFVGA